MNWTEFLAALDRAVNDSLFAPESQDAPILIAGPAESAGLTADAIWFLGANEDAWPGRGATHPLLPPEVQRESTMPHATPQLDWDLAAAMTRRLLASAPEAHFSYAKQSDGVDARPSRLIDAMAGPPQNLPAEFCAPAVTEAQTFTVRDFSSVPFPAGQPRADRASLPRNRSAPSKHLPRHVWARRIGNRPKPGLPHRSAACCCTRCCTPFGRGPPEGIRSHEELVAIPDLDSFVARHVRRVLSENLPPRAQRVHAETIFRARRDAADQACDRMAEVRGNARAIHRGRNGTEGHAAIAGLSLNLRLDRVDRLKDGSLLVIDYKTGDVSPKSWDLPRPDDVQLPLYAGFALPREKSCGGLVFAKIRAGECNREFAGRVTDARQRTLLSDLKGSNSLVRNTLDGEELDAWRAYIEQLARDFLAGRADVDPREYPNTCERCGLAGDLPHPGEPGGISNLTTSRERRGADDA